MIGVPHTPLIFPGHDDAQTGDGRVRVCISPAGRPARGREAAGSAAPARHSRRNAGVSASDRSLVHGAAARAREMARRGDRLAARGETLAERADAQQLRQDRSAEIGTGSAWMAGRVLHDDRRDPHRFARAEERAGLRHSPTARRGSRSRSHSTEDPGPPRRQGESAQDHVLLARSPRRPVVDDLDRRPLLRPGRIAHQPG